jgi:hypothetical protein
MDGLFVPILCLESIFFLGWIVVLKLRIAELAKEVDRVTELLKRKLGHVEASVEVAGRGRLQKHDQKGR